MKITVPDCSLVVLVGAAGSGKSTFAARHFRPTEVLSSDSCRALVSDDENDQDATKAAFEILHFIGGKRLEAGRLTVVDATNVRREHRQPLVELARAHHALPLAIVLDVPERLCLLRNASRPERKVDPYLVRAQRSHLRRTIGGLDREGFRRVFILRTQEEVDEADVEREPVDRRL